MVRGQKQGAARRVTLAVAILPALALLGSLIWLTQAIQPQRNESESTPVSAGDDPIDWTFFGKLSIPDIGQGWVKDEYVDGWYDQTDCSLEAQECPKFFLDDLDNIADPHSALGSMEGHPVAIEATRSACPIDLDEIWDYIEEGTMEIGGKSANFYTLSGCPLQEWSWEGAHYWWLVEDEAVLISAADASNNVVDLDETSGVFAQTTWLT